MTEKYMFHTSANPSNYPEVQLFGLKFFGGCQDDLIQVLTEQLNQPKTTHPLVVFTPNPEQIVLADHDQAFRENLQKANILVPDGGGLVTANRLGGTPPFFFDKIPGIEVVSNLLQVADSSWKILLIGGRDYDQKQLSAGWQIRSVQDLSSTQLSELQNADTSKKTIFWLEGYARVGQPTQAEEEKINFIIENIKPQVVFVALGAPDQERFVIQHLDILYINKVKVAMVVGGAFDFLTGKVKRAPAWVQQFGWEWLYRLIQEPWRWKRQLRLIEFGWLTLRTLGGN